MKQAEKALCGRLFVWACSKKRVGGYVVLVVYALRS